YVSENGEYKVFRPVKGAVIRTGGENSSVSHVSTRVNVSGTSFRYVRSVNLDGNSGVRVAYPGNYTVGRHHINVTPEDVTRGRTLDV
ncbi:MAG: hypothetical protein SV760_03795, partial [Halobacteria archaeon]|nr:hypothetical protein [Halobacteria archaeon]